MQHSRLYRSADIQMAELRWSEQQKKPTFMLMELAATALLDTLLSQWPGIRHMSIFCGSGNNGGDGLLLAAQLSQLGFSVQVGLVGMPKAGSDAEQALSTCQSAKVDVIRLSENTTLNLQDTGVIVDALLGSGARGCPRKPYRDIIQQIVASEKPVLSVDVPSGIDIDTGAIAHMNAVIQATMTLTFGGLKPGLVTGPAKQFVGRLVLASIGLDSHLRTVSAVGSMIEQPVGRYLRRSVDAHKGSMGSVVLIGGNAAMGGAIALAAESCVRMGVGYAHCVTHAVNRTLLLARNPSLLVTDYNDLDIDTWLSERHSDKEVVVIGPGLGRTDESFRLINRVYSLCQSRQRRMVVDADGLNWLAQSGVYNELWVLTPHSGEAARLLGWEDIALVEADRVTAALEIQRRYGGICVLKGPGTVVCDAHNLWINNSGTPGMARAGMGDVLAGMIGGLLTRFANDDPASVVATAVWMHGIAGERAQQSQHQESMQAIDLVSALSAVWHDIIVQNP